MNGISLKEKVLETFNRKFGSQPFGLVRAPGRVNLIGEHTDYNDGFVMPMAINREICIAFKPRGDRQLNVYSLDLDRDIHFSLDNLQRGSAGPEAYFQGVAWALDDAGFPLVGFDGVIHGNIPIGAGLSSSAALEVAATRLFAEISGFEWQAEEMALIAQRAENDWVGVDCGIMDQLSSAIGFTQMIDCRTLETQLVPLPTGTSVIVMDTGTRRGLVDSAYNERRKQCNQAARFFGVAALRDVTPDMLEGGMSGLGPVAGIRARHVVTENLRVLRAIKAMEADDPESLGKYMVESHNSLRDDYEVSSPALDRIVSLALKHPACFGARMTGAGFGGAAVALVKVQETENFINSVAPQYQHATFNQPNLYVCQPAKGASFELYD